MNSYPLQQQKTNTVLVVPKCRRQIQPETKCNIFTFKMYMIHSILLFLISTINSIEYWAFLCKGHLEVRECLWNPGLSTIRLYWKVTLLRLIWCWQHTVINSSVFLAHTIINKDGFLSTHHGIHHPVVPHKTDSRNIQSPTTKNQCEIHSSVVLSVS